MNDSDNDMVEPDPEALIRSAIAYAERGWRVFPLAPRGKEPLFANPHRHGDPLRNTCKGECGRFGHGVHDATSEIEVIRSWWGRARLANIGLACGHPGPDVLDIDVKHGAPGMRGLAELNRTTLLGGCMQEVRTWSGGMHLYFAGSGDQGNGRLPRWGLDFRSNGGYVVAPPSVVGGRPYELTSYNEHGRGELRWEDVRQALEPRPLRQPRRGNVYGAGHDSKKGFAALIRGVANQCEGNRNGYLHWAASRLAERGADEFDFAQLAGAAMTTGLRQHEVEATIASARRTSSRIIEGIGC